MVDQDTVTGDNIQNNTGLELDVVRQGAILFPLVIEPLGACVAECSVSVVFDGRQQGLDVLVEMPRRHRITCGILEIRRRDFFHRLAHDSAERFPNECAIGSLGVLRQGEPQIELGTVVERALVDR